MVWPTKNDVKLGEYDAMELPGQQLATAHASSSFDAVLNLDIKAPPACQRLTGIIATIGKASADVEVMEQMIAAGMNIAMINFSYGTRDEHVEQIKNLKQAAKNYSMTVGKACTLAIAARLSGRKIRTGMIADTYGDAVELKTDEVVRLTTDETYRERCSTYTIFIDFIGFADQMKKGNIVLLDDEAIQLRVDIISSTTLTCKIERGGFLGSYRNVYIPNVVFDMPNYSEKDKLDIEVCIKQQIDIVIVSFVHNAEAVLELRQLLGQKSKKIAIVTEIQSLQGFNNFDEIMTHANGIIIGRQELGSDITPKKLVIAQKNLIARANRANIPIIISAQLLSHMRFKQLPLRAELLDISNCILDGADGLLLSAETAVGLHPVKTVECLASICKEAESCVWSKNRFLTMVEKTPMPCDHAEACAMAAVLATQRCIASAIVAITTTGRSAQLISKYNPRCPIIALSRYSVIARQLHMWKGVIPLVYEDPINPDWTLDSDNRINYCINWSLDMGFVRVGDPVVLVSGWKQGSGFTNTLRIVYASASNPTSA